jgi:H/ACA ribonucleoprotein complex subunit 4
MDLNKIKQEKTISELLEFSIINIDKSSGPTSFNVSDFVRKTLNETGIKIRKTSHFGTLDPKVTGVLPIAINRACKLTGYFMGHDKEYIGIMRIHEDVELEEINKAIKKKFLGKIKQTPPVKSRVKRQERVREVKKFELLEKQGMDILFHSTVEGGTYIRKLIDDLGKELGIGAHMLELRRVRAGLFKEEEIDNLYDFAKAVEELKKGNENPLRKILIPAEIISEIHPVVQVKKDALKRLLTGKPIIKSDLKKKEKFDEDETICVFSTNKFVGMYKVINKKVAFAKPLFVLQDLK